MYTVDVFYKDVDAFQMIQVSATNIAESAVSQTFLTVANVFEFEIGDVIIVIKAGAVCDNKIIHRVANLIHQRTLKTHCYFFIEDLFTQYPYPPELALIEQIVKYHNLPHTVYHCEKNLLTRYYDWFLVDSVLSHKHLPNITTTFSTTLCCLNRRYTDYRYLACAVLANYQQVSVTQHYSLNQIENCAIDCNRLDPALQLENGLSILQSAGKQQNHHHMVEVDYTSPNAVQQLIKVTQNSYCSLVTESKFHSNMPNFSEKTLRAIVSGRPFLLLAPAGTLQLLRDLGFQTFSKYWNETYDHVTDSTERFQQVMLTIMGILETKDLSLEPMMHILEHNQQQIQYLPERMNKLLQFV